jgi:hypothetical protein
MQLARPVDEVYRIGKHFEQPIQHENLLIHKENKTQQLLMSKLVKVVKVNSIGSIGCWSNFEGVWEVSTSVGSVIRNKSFGLVYRHAPGINTGGKDPTKICMTWGNTSLVPVLYEFQYQGYTCLIHTSQRSVLDQISRPDWYEKLPKVPNTEDQTGMKSFQKYQIQRTRLVWEFKNLPNTRTSWYIVQKSCHTNTGTDSCGCHSNS